MLETGAPPTACTVPESVLVVIHTRALEVLLIERADAPPGHWQSVTGSKDTPCEPWRATAQREVAEETGIDCGEGSPLAAALVDWHLENRYAIWPQWLHRYAPGVVHNTERVFGLCLPQRCAVRLAAREHRAHGWWPWREAADRCFSASNAEAVLLLPRFAAPAFGATG